LYGESYGTAVAQRYAAAHGDRLDALILDGVMDLGQSTQATWIEAGRSFEAVLDRVLAACRADTWCSADLPDPAESLAKVLRATGPAGILATFADNDGILRSHKITHTAVVDALGDAMYTRGGRMLVLRSLAAFEAGDWVPLGRLTSPGGRYVTTVDESSFTYFATWCADFLGGGGGADAAATDVDGYVRAGREAGLFDLRLGSAFLSAAPCLAWPAHDPTATPLPHLTTTPYPVFVLGSLADPVTPIAAARRVADDLESSYLIESDGGPHVTFGRGDDCPDAVITAFLVDARRPASQVTRCPVSVIEEYPPWIGVRSLADTSVADAGRLIDEEAYLHPDYIGWDGTDQIDLGCRFGGRIVVIRQGDRDTLRYDGCEVFPGAPMTGTGYYGDDGTLRLDPQFGDSEMRIEYDEGGNLHVTGIFRGTSVDVTD
jgi:pimeloyl-ACP methyl ester carboxylesterase